jgi:nitrite reductase (NADH) small subunit
MVVRLGPIGQIPPGEGRAFIVGSTEIAVFHTREGGVYATQARCPHRGGPLADGLTDGATVVCPLHDRIYSLRTGEGIGNECAVAVYAAHIKDSQIWVDIADGGRAPPPLAQADRAGAGGP